MTSSLKFAVLTAAILVAGAASAKEYTITLKDKVFTPATLEITAGEKHKLIVKNQDAAAAEIESDDLDIEKVVAASSEAVINFGPVKAGTYEYENEFHDKSKGTIIAK